MKIENFAFRLEIIRDFRNFNRGFVWKIRSIVNYFQTKSNKRICLINCDFFLKSNSPKKVRSDIDHSKSTNHKHHFCQRDHGSISYFFSSRLVSKLYSRSQKKFKFYHKTLNSWPINPKFCMMVVSGQEIFLMSWVWKNLCTMGQNLIFYENF